MGMCRLYTFYLFWYLPNGTVFYLHKSKQEATNPVNKPAHSKVSNRKFDLLMPTKI